MNMKTIAVAHNVDPHAIYAVIYAIVVARFRNTQLPFGPRRWWY